VVTVPTQSVSGTRSAWGGKFQRLLQFDFPGAEAWYIRFGLFHEAGKHPILAAGANGSKMYFWDLQMLENAGGGIEKPNQNKKKTATSELQSRDGRAVSEASVGSTGAHSTSSGQTPSATTLEKAVLKKGSKSVKSGKGKAKRSETTRGIGDPFKSIIAHKKIEVPKYDFNYRQVAWSRGGEWCVGTGDYGVVSIFSRWENGFPEATGKFCPLHGYMKVNGPLQNKL
jgi:polycomb protein EED